MNTCGTRLENDEALMSLTATDVGDRLQTLATADSTIVFCASSRSLLTPQKINMVPQNHWLVEESILTLGTRVRFQE